MTGLKVIHATGTPRERGRAMGDGLGEEMERSVSFYRDYFGRRGVGDGELSALQAPLLASAEATLPDLVEILRGMAEVAGVPLAWLLAANTFEELDPLVEARRVERCTSFVVRTDETTLLAHDEQWLAGDSGCVGVVVDHPGEGSEPVVWSPTVASWLPAVGMNSRGHAQGVMSLVASDDGTGVPRVFVSRHVLGATGREDAVRRAGLAGRSGGYAYMCAEAGGDTYVVETSADRHSLLERVNGHTNHYLDTELARIGEEPSPGSLARYERICSLLAERAPRSAEDAMALLADHGSGAPGPCVHPEPEDGDEGDAIVFAMVCDLEARRMWVSPGQPCEAPFIEVDLSEEPDSPDPGR